MLKNTFQDGVDAYNNGDFETATKIYSSFANQGDAVAQYNLASMYYNGEGVRQDYIFAYMWFNLASANNKSYKEALNKISTKMNSQQIEKAQKLSRLCLASNYKNCP